MEDRCDNTEKYGEACSPVSAEESFAISELRRLNIPFVRLTHPAASTMELCAGIGAEYGARHCKNLFLTNRSGTDFFLLLMDPDKPYRTSLVSRALGVSRLSFAAAEQLKAVLGLEPGAVSVMGLANESAKQAYREGRLHAAVDTDLLKNDRICVHPNVNTSTLVILTRDLLRFIEEEGCELREIEIN